MTQENQPGPRLQSSNDRFHTPFHRSPSTLFSFVIVTPLVVGSLMMLLQARDASMAFLIGIFLLCTGAVFNAKDFIGAIARSLVLPFAVGLTMWFLDITSAGRIMVLGIESLGLALVLLDGPFWRRCRNVFFSSAVVFVTLWIHHTGDQGVPLFLGVTGLVLSAFILHQTSRHPDGEAPPP